jgi:hypothetical protein
MAVTLQSLEVGEAGAEYLDLPATFMRAEPERSILGLRSRSSRRYSMAQQNQRWCAAITHSARIATSAKSGTALRQLLKIGSRRGLTVSPITR